MYKWHANLQMAFVNLMCLASGVIRFQLFLAVQKSSLCCLILQTGISYPILLCLNVFIWYFGRR